jgi:HK97 family phage major capsid protein
MDYNAEAKSLNEQRMKIWTEAQRLLEDTKGDFSAEQAEQWQRMNADMDSLAQRRDTMLDAAKRETEAGQLREAERHVFGEQTVDRKERSEAEQFRAWAQGRERRTGTDWENEGRNAWYVDIRGAMKERELLRRGASPAEIRALLWDTGSVGSTVPTDLSRTLYQYLEAGIAALRMPTTKITTDSGNPLEFPREATTGAATQVIAQGTAIGGTDPTFDKMSLDAYKYGQLAQLSSEVIQDSGVDMVGYIGRRIGRNIGNLIDAELILGTGTGEPQGMMTAGTGAAGTVSTGGSLINPTYETLIDLVYSVNDAYRASGNAAFLTRDATAGVLRKLRDGAGRLLGFPVYTDANVASLASAATVMAFGDWSAYYVRLVGGLVIERSDEYAFNTDLVTFRGKQRIDGDFIDLTATNRLRRTV